MGSAAPALIVAASVARRLRARLHPWLAGQHDGVSRPPAAPRPAMTPRACRPPSRCGRRRPRHSAQPAPFARRTAGTAPRLPAAIRTSRVVAAARHRRRKHRPPMAHQYQLSEHLYMIRYKCLWAMTVAAAMGYSQEAGNRCRRMTSSFGCGWPGSISWRGSPRPISRASSASRGCAPTACWARPAKAAWSTSRSTPGWPAASSWSAQLVHETGLKDAVVVPTPTDPDQIAPVLGRATADYLARHLGETRVRGARHRLGHDAARDHPPSARAAISPSSASTP